MVFPARVSTLNPLVSSLCVCLPLIALIVPLILDLFGLYFTDGSAIVGIGFEVV